MKKLITDQNKYETLLTIYFGQESELFLSTEMINTLNAFMDFFRTEDKYNNTFNADSIQKVYSNIEFESREQLLKFINMSEATLFRFRGKIVERLKTHLQEAFKHINI